MDTLVAIMIVIALLVIGIVSLLHRGRARMSGILTTLFSLGIGVFLYRNISQLQNWKTALLVVLLLILLLVSIYLFVVINDMRLRRQKNSKSPQANSEVVCTPARTPLTLTEWEASVSVKPAIPKLQKKHISANVEEASIEPSLFVRNKPAKFAEESREAVAAEDAISSPAVSSADDLAVVDLPEADQPSHTSAGATDSIGQAPESWDTDKTQAMGFTDESVWAPEPEASESEASSAENGAIEPKSNIDFFDPESQPFAVSNTLGDAALGDAVLDAEVLDDVALDDAALDDAALDDAALDDAALDDAALDDAALNDAALGDAALDDAALDAGVLDADVLVSNSFDSDALDIVDLNNTAEVSDTLLQSALNGDKLQIHEDTAKQPVDGAQPEPETQGALQPDIDELKHLIGSKRFIEAQDKIFHMLHSHLDLTSADKQQILLIMKLLKEKEK